MFTKRARFSRNARSSVSWRAAWTASAWPKCTWSGVIRPIPLWWCPWLYQSKKPRQNALASSMQPKLLGNRGWFFRVLKWASE